MQPHLELVKANIAEMYKIMGYKDSLDLISNIDSSQILFLNDRLTYPSDSYILYETDCSMQKFINFGLSSYFTAIFYYNVFKQKRDLFLFVNYRQEWWFIGSNQHSLVGYKINPMPLKEIKILPHLFPDSSEYRCLDSIIHKGKFADLTKDTILSSIEFRADSKEWKLNDLDSLFKTYQYSLYSFYKFESEGIIYKMYVFTTGFDIIDGTEFRHIITVTFKSVDNKPSLLHSIFYNMIYGHPVDNWVYPGK
jgi:hypothetical protein